MSFGIALIFLGVLVARTPDGGSLSQPTMRPAVRPAPVSVGGLQYIESLLERPDAEIDALCAGWSVPREEGETLSRSDARRAWRLRSQLSPEAVAAFDRQAIPARRQVTVLYHEVIAWERPARDDIAEIVSADPASRRAQGQA
jgi:hypothetical protein